MKVIYEVTRSEVEDIINNLFKSQGYDPVVIINNDGSATVQVESDVSDFNF